MVASSLLVMLKLLRQLNFCQLYLQVTLLSETTTFSGIKNAPASIFWCGVGRLSSPPLLTGIAPLLKSGMNGNLSFVVPSIIRALYVSALPLVGGILHHITASQNQLAICNPCTPPTISGNPIFYAIYTILVCSSSFHNVLFIPIIPYSLSAQAMEVPPQVALGSTNAAFGWVI